MVGLKPSIDVWIVGKTGGEYEASWGDTAALLRSGWSGHLHMISTYVSERERVDFFSACDGVILPYRQGYATSSGPLRDAVENGKIVIVSDQYELGEFVKMHQLGLTFLPENVDALRGCLEVFADMSGDELQHVSQRCEQVVNKDSWVQIGNRYHLLFASLMVRNNPNC